MKSKKPTALCKQLASSMKKSWLAEFDCVARFLQPQSTVDPGNYLRICRSMQGNLIQMPIVTHYCLAIFDLLLLLPLFLLIRALKIDIRDRSSDRDNSSNTDGVDTGDRTGNKAGAANEDKSRDGNRSGNEGSSGNGGKSGDGN